jgi:hypothetical protein
MYHSIDGCGATCADSSKFGVFDEDPKLDHAALKKVAPEEVDLATVGFGKELYWKFKDNGERMHEISVSQGHSIPALFPGLSHLTTDVRRYRVH